MELSYKAGFNYSNRHYFEGASFTCGWNVEKTVLREGTLRNDRCKGAETDVLEAMGTSVDSGNLTVDVQYELLLRCVARQRSTRLARVSQFSRGNTTREGDPVINKYGEEKSNAGQWRQQRSSSRSDGHSNNAHDQIRSQRVHQEGPWAPWLLYKEKSVTESVPVELERGGATKYRRLLHGYQAVGG